jgi:TolB-like protein
MMSLSSLTVYAEGDQRIAVLELANPAGLARQEVQYLSDLLRRLASSELAQNFLVIDKANVLELLPPERTLEECIGKCAVETGRLLQASYIITGDIIKFGPSLRVTVRLHDTQTGRLIASEVASGRTVLDMESGIQEAGGRLLRRLIKGARETTGEGTRERIGSRTQAVGALTQQVIISLQSNPRGAAIVVDGVQKCAEGTSSCKVEVNEGAHQITMTKTDYFVRSGTVTFNRENKDLEWSLDPNFATLRVITTPSNLKFTVNGQEHQGAHTQRITPQKSYRVVSSDRCFDVSGEKVSAGKPGDQITVKLTPSKLFAILDVSARSETGAPAEATVTVDGEGLGSTPGQYRVSVCAKELVVSKGSRKFTQSLSLSKGSTSRVVATLNLDPDCDVTHYVNSKEGGYFWPITLTLGGIGAFAAWNLTANEAETTSLARTKRGLFEIESLGMVAAISGGTWWIVRYSKRSQLFTQWTSPLKCRAEIREAALNRFKLAPTLAPRNGGGVLGFSGTF